MMLDADRGRWDTAPMALAGESCRIQDPSRISAGLEEMTYPITPATVEVHAGIIGGEMTDMHVVQHVDRNSGRPFSGARLMGTLRLWSSSETHSVRLVGAKIQYLDGQWHPMKVEDSRMEATLTFTTYGAEWLDPGRKVVHAIDVAFPAEALKARRLTGLRLEVDYVAFPYREETFSVAVSIESAA